MSIYEKVGGEVTVNSVLSGSQTYVELARLADGRFVAMWESNDLQQDQSSIGLKGRLLAANGTPLGSEFLINTATLNGQERGGVTGLANGGFVVTWTTFDTTQDGSESAIKAQLFDAAGAKQGGEFLVNSNTNNVQWYGSVAALDTGGFVISWDAYGHPQDSGRGIAAQVYNAAGVRVGSEFLVNTTTADFQMGNEISTLSGGRFVVTWLTQISGQFDLRAQVFDASGAKIGGEILVNAQTAQTQIELAVADLANGGFVITWTTFDTTQDGSGYAIKAQLFNAAGAKVGGEFLVNTSTVANQQTPAVDGLANGDFVIAWRTSDSTTDEFGGGIKAQVFDAAGAKIGGEFRVNTAGAFVESEPAVVDLGNGAFAIAWTGGSSSGEIRSQVYSSGSAPVIHSNGGGASAAVTVAEDSAGVTTVAAYDIDSASIAYAITGGADAALFAIDAATGALSFVAAPDFETPADADADNVYQVVVRASDGARSDEQTLLVSVASLEDVATITSNGGASSAEIAVLENGVSVTTVTASGVGSMIYSIAGGADAGRFQIDSATGQLSFRTAPNREAPTDAGANNVYDVVVGVTNGATSDTQALAITVGNVNEAPVISGNTPGYVIVTAWNENSTASLVVWAPDPDGDVVTYSITGPDADKFVMNPSTGWVRFINPPDYEAPGSAQGTNQYRFDVIASDGTLSDVKLIGVSLQNLNEAPSITSGGGGATAALAVSENGTLVTTVVAVDPEHTALTYSISGGADAARFAINASTGALSFVVVPNFEAPADAGADNVYDVIVRASDGSFTDTQAIAVAVGNVNEAPVISSNGGGASATLTVYENSTAVAIVAASDVESGVTYALAGGADAARFAIDAATGELSFLAAPDHEAPDDANDDNVYEVVVSASDGTLSDTQALSLTLANVNEGMTFVSSPAFTVAENQPLVGNLLAEDIDGDTLSYHVVGGADGWLFGVDAAGVLGFDQRPDYETPLDADGDNVYEVEVVAFDGEFSAYQTLTVTVTDIEFELPLAFVETVFGIAENTAGNSVQLLVNNGISQLLTYEITGGADAARFSLEAATGLLVLGQANNFEAPGDANGDNVFEVEVSAHNDTQFAAATITFAVGNLDEAPVIFTDGGGATAAVSMYEGTFVPVTTVSASDPENAPIGYSIVGGADAARFVIGATLGNLSFANAVNFGAPTDANGDNVYEVVVEAHDGSLSDTQAISVTVLDVTHAPVLSGPSTYSVLETLTTTVGTISASDEDGDPLAYSISGGVDAAFFSIDSATGALRFITAPDYEVRADSGANNVYNVTVAVSDGGLSVSKALAITVTNWNESPIITSNGGGATAAISFAENSNATITFVTAIDPEGAPRTYSIAGGADAARFLMGSNGQLIFVSSRNFEAPNDANGDNVYEVIVRASDGLYDDTQAISVIVTNVNEAPVITSSGGGTTAAISFSENSASTIVTVASTDPEGTPRTYAIVGGADAARFTINATSGQLAFVSARNFEAPNDANLNNVYEVTVQASDGTLTDTQAISVTVTNVNEGVTITSGSAFTVAENGLAVTTVTASDLDGTAPTFSISGGVDAARFTINAASGALSFVANPNFEAPADTGVNNVYDVIVRASDGSLSATRALTITVVNANEAPVITSNGGGATAAVTVNENGTAVATVASTDPENTARSYAIAGGADAARFAINATTGALSFIGAPNFEAPADANADNVYEVTVRASDGALSDTQDISVTVANVNEKVSITSGSAFSITENGLAVTTVTATDLDGTAPGYAIAGGADAALFAIDPVTGALSFLAAPDFEAPTDTGTDNVYEVIVSASDGSFSDDRALTITVTDINEPLQISSDGAGATAALSVSENTGAVTTVAASDPENLAPVYSIAGGADAALFAIDACTGALSFVAAPDHEAAGDADGDNVYDVTVSATDGTHSDTQALSVTVANVNEAPEIVSNGGGAAADVVASENGTAVTAVLASDVDSGVTYALAGGADAALFTIDAATGVLAFVAAPDYEAPGDADGDNLYEVVVSATDGGLSDTQALSVIVSNLNEAPAIASSASVSVSENGTAATIVAATDPEGGVTYAIAGGADAALFAIDEATGALSFLAAPDFETPADADSDNFYEVVVSASDGSLSDTQALSVIVSNLNEAPVIASPAAISVSENGTAVTTVAAADPEGGVTYTLAGGADAARFAIDASTGALAFIAAPDFEMPADADGDNVYEVLVSAGDGSLSDTRALAVSVANLNDNAPVIALFQVDSIVSAMAENNASYFDFGATDADGDTVVFGLAGQDAASFTVDAATGLVQFVAPPDFEAPGSAGGTNTYDFDVVASDGTFSDVLHVTLNVDNANEAVTITSGTAFTVAEDSLEVTIVTASDLDGTAPGYAITGGADATLFAIDAVTGALAFVVAPDHEVPGDADGDNVYEVEVAASDDGGLVDYRALTITVADVEEPRFVQTAFEVDEHQFGLESLALTLDADWSFELAGGADSSSFDLNLDTGTLWFADRDFEAPGDADGNNVYEVLIRAFSDIGEVTSVVTFAVRNVQEAPVFVTSDLWFLSENESYVGVVRAVDQEGAAVHYAVTDGYDAHLFAIDQATGELNFIAAPDFEAPADADGDSVYLVEVVARDGEVESHQILSVFVMGENEAPVIVSGGGGMSAAFVVAENWTSVTSIVAADPEGSVTYALAGGADAALFAIDAATGALGFLATPDFEAPADADGDNVYDVVVSAGDGTVADTQSLSVAVTDVNEASWFVSATAWSLDENEDYIGVLAALDPESQGLTYFVAGGADAHLFRVIAATGEFGFVTAPDFESPTDADGDNVYELVVGATDNDTFVTTAIHVTLADVDETPTITSPALFVAFENTTAAAIVAATDPEGAALKYHIVGGADSARLSIDLWTGALAFTQAPNFEAPADADGDNVYEVLVEVDDGTHPLTQAVSIIVGNANEAPVITSGGGGATATYSVSENIGAAAIVAASDPEGSVTYALAGGADAARFTINAATGALSFVVAPDYDAPADANGDNLYQVVVSASDGSLADTQALTVSVGNVVGLTLNGTSAANTLTGGSEEDTIHGLGGADTLSGLGGNDSLDGGDGQDRLTGGAGADLLTGGLKADDFVFTALGDSTLAASDRIVDFSRSQGDDIDLSVLDANANVAGNQAFSFIGGAAFSGSAGQLRAFQQSGDTFVQGDVNGDGVADFQIILDPLVTLAASDFIL